MATGNPVNNWKSNNKIISLQMSKPIDNGVYLQYEGKKTEIEILGNLQSQIYTVTYPLLTQQGQNDLKQLYFSDNLNTLSVLCQDEKVKGKVNLIYIDPPYATQSVFQTQNQQDAYTDLLTGATYFEFLRERLILLRELLADSGSIYIHLDGNAIFETKILMDEIFGAKNFRNLITRKKCNSKNYTRKTYGNISDYILFYTKTDHYVWNRPFDTWEQEKIIKQLCGRPLSIR